MAIRHDQLDFLWQMKAIPLLLVSPALLSWLFSFKGLPNKVGILLSTTLLLGFLALALAGVERLWWVNGNEYPSWLTSGLPLDVGSMSDLSQYCSTGIEVYEKNNGVFARCGLLRFEGSVWRIDMLWPIKPSTASKEVI